MSKDEFSRTGFNFDLIICRIDMPLQESSMAIEKAINTIEQNRTHMYSKTKQDHSFLAVLAGTGSGKSWLCHEIAHHIEKKLPNVIKLTIDFSKSDAKHPMDLQTTHVLGLRVAAKLLFECSLGELTGFLQSTYNPDSSPVVNFGFNEVMAAFFRNCCQNSTANIVYLVLTMDEINYVPKDFPPGAIKEMICIIGGYMCNSDQTAKSYSLACQHQLTLLPVISGTIHGYTISEVVFGTSYHFEFGSVPLLSFEAMKQIFCTICPKNELWLKNQVFKNTLKLLGQVPRCLEKIMKVCSNMQEFRKLDDKLAMTIAEQSGYKMSCLYYVSWYFSLIQELIFFRQRSRNRVTLRVSYWSFSMWLYLDTNYQMK